MRCSFTVLRYSVDTVLVRTTFAGGCRGVVAGVNRNTEHLALQESLPRLLAQRQRALVVASRPPVRDLIAVPRGGRCRTSAAKIHRCESNTFVCAYVTPLRNRTSGGAPLSGTQICWSVWLCPRVAHFSKSRRCFSAVTRFRASVVGDNARPFRGLRFVGS